MSLIRLPYLGNSTCGDLNKSPKGYNEVKGIDKYNGALTRNVCIIRVDLLLHLSEYFAENTIRKYRSAIYYILAGYGMSKNRKLILESLEYIYKEDDIFKVKFGRLIYFRDTNLERLSIYDALLEDVRSSLVKAWDQVVSKVPYIKIICDSHLYLYFSVSEAIPTDELLQIKGLEVISK